MLKFTFFTESDFKCQLSFTTSCKLETTKSKYVLTHFPDLSKIDFSKRLISSIINEIITNDNAKPFLRPVDPIRDNCPKYKEIIKTPMDLSTIYQKNENNKYKSLQELSKDLKLILDNAILFNQNSDSPISIEVCNHSVGLSKFIATLFSELQKNPNKSFSDKSIEAKQKITKENHQNLRKKPAERKIQSENKEKSFSNSEKQQLADSILKLKGNSLKGCFEILYHQSFNPQVFEGGDITIDLQNLGSEDLSLLSDYINTVGQSDDSQNFFYTWRPVLPPQYQDLLDKYKGEIALWRQMKYEKT